MKKGLGRGLGAIMGKDIEPEAKTEDQKNTGVPSDPNENRKVSRETSLVRISYIEPRKDQPRKNMDQDSLKELADSIKAHGVLQPILVRKVDSSYEIIAGERRWRAARLAGLKEIPVIVKELDDREVAEAALIENIQREDLSSVEEARAYRTLIDVYHLTQEELSHRLSKSRSAIANSLRLLNLDEGALRMLEEGLLDAGHARAILAVSSKKDQLSLAQEVSDRGLSVRDTEKLVKRYISEKEKGEKGTAPSTKTKESKMQSEYNMYLEDLSSRLTEAMKTKVSIRPNGAHKGHINIEYYSDEELNEIAGKLL